jgi:hypothetical protein
MPAFGRKLPFKITGLAMLERPLSVKADIQHEAKLIGAASKWAPKWALPMPQSLCCIGHRFSLTATGS